MAIERSLKRYSSVEILTELGAEQPQLLEAEFIQLHALLQCEPNCVADLFMCRAEGTSLVHKIGRAGHRVQIARLRRSAHPLEVELQGRSESRHERQHLGYKLNLKCR